MKLLPFILILLLAGCASAPKPVAVVYPYQEPLPVNENHITTTNRITAATVVKTVVGDDMLSEAMDRPIQTPRYFPPYTPPRPPLPTTVTVYVNYPKGWVYDPRCYLKFYTTFDNINWTYIGRTGLPQFTVTRNYDVPYQAFAVGL